MTWYAAHLVMQVKFNDEEQLKFPVWENIFLVEADTIDDAMSKAEEIGVNSYSKGEFRWEGKSAHWVFKGVRKWIEIRNYFEIEDNSKDGTEVTYNTFEFGDRESLIKFVNGESSTATIVD